MEPCDSPEALWRGERQSRQRIDIPAGGVVGWWLTHQDPASGPDKALGDCQGLIGGSEPSCHHRISAAVPRWVVAQVFSVALHHRYLRTPSKNLHCSLQSIGAFGSTINQGHAEFGAIESQHQARDSST